jgi:hypothetical protein
MTHRKGMPLGHWIWMLATVWLAVGVAAVLRGCA